MKGVQSFIISTKKAEKDTRDLRKTQANPFNNEEKKTVMIADTLQYGTGPSTFRCTMRYARRGECSTNEECQRCTTQSQGRSCGRSLVLP